jgi:hypothetical protein
MMSEEMKVSMSGLGAEFIEQILEFSADAQIERRQSAPDSPAYHNLTRAIVAYGEILEAISTLQRQEEQYLELAAVI